MPAGKASLDAVHDIYIDHHGWLCSWLRRKLGCAHNAADLAQDTFVRIIAGRKPESLVEPSFDMAAWVEGVIVAKQMRLADFAAELSRYREAPVRCDPAAADLRVSGVFQIEGADAPSRALEILTRTLPVRLVPGPGGSVTVTRS